MVFPLALVTSIVIVPVSPVPPHNISVDVIVNSGGKTTSTVSDVLAEQLLISITIISNVPGF